MVDAILNDNLTLVNGQGIGGVVLALRVDPRDNGVPAVSDCIELKSFSNSKWNFSYANNQLTISTEYIEDSHFTIIRGMQ